MKHPTVSLLFQILEVPLYIFQPCASKRPRYANPPIVPNQIIRRCFVTFDSAIARFRNIARELHAFVVVSPLFFFLSLFLFLHIFFFMSHLCSSVTAFADRDLIWKYQNTRYKTDLLLLPQLHSHFWCSV